MSRNKQRNKELSLTSVKGRLSLFLDARAPSQVQEAIHAMGITPILLPPYDKLPAPVSAHPDLLLFDLGQELLVYEDYYTTNRHLFSEMEVRTTKHLAAPCYPMDVGMDALALGEYLFCLPQHTCEPILADKTVVPVKQGYAACAALKVSERAIVTADKGIARAAKEKGIAVLPIEPGHIELPGYDYGFIGGTAFSWEEGLYFAGDLSTHPQGNAIATFCQGHGVAVHSLVKGMPLADLGFLKYNKKAM